jgi:hypothetical protein
VQQLVRVVSPVDTPWVTVALCLPTVLACAWLSHRFVEAPALRLKSPVFASLRRFAIKGGGASALGDRIAGVAFAVAALAVLTWSWPVWWWVSSSLLGVALVAALARAAGGRVL